MAKVKVQSPMQKQFADNYEEQRKEMFLHVARELTGRAKQRQLPKGKALDWEKFNEYFNNFYADHTADEMLDELLNNCYWLASEQAIIELHFRYVQDAVKASKRNAKDEDDDDNDDFIK
ncbi:hypothetical protein IQ264_24400 [Phormidium sp. LEGE 05292]|uniref:hypothetical protein n=1 Tax=[Phormidium] sp. LEGE 05292 TaxID=767427 RepID=UPI001881556C|nr:hypothetical protein [Phormidium sp. LEGE 05292]MBE9228560.1 hypothetical protein [Phormidium sp. LEGE 05292]